jgi:hypothetical protein
MEENLLHNIRNIISSESSTAMHLQDQDNEYHQEHHQRKA